MYEINFVFYLAVYKLYQWRTIQQQSMDVFSHNWCLKAMAENLRVGATFKDGVCVVREARVKPHDVDPTLLVLFEMNGKQVEVDIISYCGRTASYVARVKDSDRQWIVRSVYIFQEIVDGVIWEMSGRPKLFEEIDDGYDYCEDLSDLQYAIIAFRETPIEWRNPFYVLDFLEEM